MREGFHLYAFLSHQPSAKVLTPPQPAIERGWISLIHEITH